MDKTTSRANELRGLCAVVTKIARTDLQKSLDRHQAGISALEHGVLRQLSLGASSIAEISRRMGTSPSTLVYVVDRLAAKGLVQRTKDPTDRRREPLLLEKKGAALFSQVPKIDMGSALVQSLVQMTEEQQRELVELLTKFVGNIPGSELYRRRKAKTGEGAPSEKRKKVTRKPMGRRLRRDD